MVPRSMAALAIALAAACASAPPPPQPVECPAPAPRAAPELAFDLAGDAQRGATVFERECNRCHASEPAQRALGTPASTPRLDCADWIAATSDAYLYDAINRGPGAWGHGPVPPLGERLTPAQIADLVAYLRSLSPTPNPAGSAPTTLR